MAALRLLFLVAVILLLLPRAASGVEPESWTQPAAGNIYSDPQRRFQVAIPQGWTPAATGDMLRISRGDAYANIIVMDRPQQPRELAAGLAQQVGQQWRDFQQLQQGEAMLAGLRAHYIVCAGTNPKGVPAVIKVVAAASPAHTFVLMLSAPQAEFNAARPALDQIEGSFSVGGAGAPPGPAPSPNRAVMGIATRDISPEDLGKLGVTNLQGTLVQQVQPGAPAEQAGIQPGDVIVALDRQPVQRTADLLRLMSTRNPGETVELVVVRGGQPKVVQVRLVAVGGVPGASPGGAPTPRRAEPPPVRAPDLPAARPAPPASTLKSHRGQGYTISIPTNWNPTASPSGLTTWFGAADAVKPLPEGGMSISLGMLSAVHSTTARDLRAATDEFLGVISAGSPGIKTLSRGAATVGGQPAESILLEGPSSLGGTETEINWVVTVLRPNGLLAWVLISPRSEFNDLRPLFGKIVSSVQFTAGQR